MKIVNIFAGKLFAFHYDEHAVNEYRRLLKIWNNQEYVYQFLVENKSDIKKSKSIESTLLEIIDDANELDGKLIEIALSNDKTFDHFFKPLHNQEYGAKILSLQKGRESLLRMYAIKIDEDTFVITGGAIKLPGHHLMENREHTRIELQKLNFAKDYFKSKDVFDEESFFEFLNEE